MNFDKLRRSPWTIPAILTVGSFFALIAALAADGIWDWISWILLFLPILIIFFALFSRRPADRP